ncbi:PA3496 family putative envelope integrity protein [Methylobacter svalbardensis]|uniref:PA3496 family putative envelope integrity protein n=1 Tax=Methylobacter svalbardensis TaxID=3080016 RepID=UPI0030EB76C9
MNISKSVSDKSTAEIGVDKNKDEGDLDIEGFDLGLSNEYIALPNESEKAAKKMAARRKIELYWEKKRLQEQLGDFYDDDLDLDF